jgi:plastocyanin
MRIDSTSGVRRSAALALLVTGALAMGILAGCGGDDDEIGTLEITASEEGGSTVLEAPGQAEAGITEITLINQGEQPHSGQLIRVEGERSEEDVAEAFESASRGEEFPEWFYGGGGTGTVNPGERATVTQELEAGSSYWLVDDEVRGRPPFVEIEITGEAGDGTLPETDSVVNAVDFGFESDGVTAGETITFRNEGEQPHHMIAVPITDDDASIEEVEAFFGEEAEEGGPPPVDFDQGVFTSVLEGGDEQVSAAQLDAGRWALVCFISNREGGPPHIEFGMIDELEVE